MRVIPIDHNFVVYQAAFPQFLPQTRPKPWGRMRQKGGNVRMDSGTLLPLLPSYPNK